MKVKELVEQLKKMPQDAEVLVLVDAEDTPQPVDVAYQAKGGGVFLSHRDRYVMQDDKWPIGHREKKDRFDSFYLGHLIDA